MKSKLTNTARDLRKKSTDAERLLWRHLRARQLEGVKFRRQQPLGDYIVDFVCLERRIVIEVDGGQHMSAREKDSERDKWLVEQGFRVLRFWNNEVFKNTDGVLEKIRESCLDNLLLITPILTFPRQGGRDSEMTWGINYMGSGDGY